MSRWMLREKKKWIENLEYREELYVQNTFGDYNIIIVTTGLNDIKQMLVPFLLEDEIVDSDDKNADDNHNKKSNNKGKKVRGFAADMKRLIRLLNMEQVHDNLNASDQHEHEQLKPHLHHDCPLL